VQKNDDKKYFPRWDMGCAKCSYDHDKQKSDSCRNLKMVIFGCMGPQSGFSFVIFDQISDLKGRQALYPPPQVVD
jgi:hypothetical protein